MLMFCTDSLRCKLVSASTKWCPFHGRPTNIAPGDQHQLDTAAWVFCQTCALSLCIFCTESFECYSCYSCCGNSCYGWVLSESWIASKTHHGETEEETKAGRSPFDPLLLPSAKLSNKLLEHEQNGQIDTNRSGELNMIGAYRLFAST